MRSPTKPKETLSKVLPLRWSFGSKERTKTSVHAQSGELVEYLESGRRPRCTKEPIVTLVATPPQRPAHGRAFEAAGDCSSPSGGSVSDRPAPGTCYSPKIPEGQSRPCVERSNGNGNGNLRDDGSLRQRSVKRARQDQGGTLDLQFQRGLILGGHMSHSAPPSRDSTLRRTKAVASRPQKDLLPIQSEDRGVEKGQEGRSQDSLLSFFKPGFMKKDVPRSPVKGHERRMNGYGTLGKVATSNLAKLSLSNGTLTAEDRKVTNIIPNCDDRRRQVPLANGKAVPHDPPDIQRAHSSSSVQTKMDLTFRRCASLQRNGDVAAPGAQRVLLTDKPSYATLQRMRYSTTSLGKNTPWAESGATQ